jgi:hypothetical protein
VSDIEVLLEDLKGVVAAGSTCAGTVCPTGALMLASEYDMRQADSWDESRQTVTIIIGPYAAWPAISNCMCRTTRS